MSKKKESLASKGGNARAAKLSPARRSEIARAAALAKHGTGKEMAPTQEGAPARSLRATHRGSFKADFGIDVDCYVLDDEKRTGVISKRGMGLALGMGESGSVFPYFISGKKVSEYVGSELAEKLAKPLIFQWTAVGANTPPVPVHGYDVTILIDVCKVIIKAAAVGVLQKRHEHIVKQAHVIQSASAKHGITQLVYALSGYDVTRAEQIAAFKEYVRQEAREYEKAFPDRLYEEWYRLYELPRPGKNKPWKFRTLTIDHVYKPLARSNGKIYELTRYQRSLNRKDRWKKLHQFLEAIGLTALGWHLGELVGIAKRAKTLAEYEQNVEEEFGVKRKMVQSDMGW
jgi:P63C domain-containing protein